MISPTMSQLLQGILITILLTATSFEEELRCPASTFGCTNEQRPRDCPAERGCCRVRKEDQEATYCVNDLSKCPSDTSRCPTDQYCHSNGICCEISGHRENRHMCSMRNTSTCPYGSSRYTSSDLHCTNGGICCQVDSSLICVCHGGYTGKFCQRRSRPYSIAKRASEGQISTPTPIGDDALSDISCISTKQQSYSSDYTTQSSEQLPATWIGLTAFVVVIVVAVLVCIASVVITRLIFKRKYGSVSTGIISSNTDAEKKYQNLKTRRLNEDGEMADHYDNLELYDKGYETIDEDSLDDPNYVAIQDIEEYLDVIAEADDGNIEEADDNDYAATEDPQSEQTEENTTYQSLPVLETPSIERSS